jgi:hypothetical protein
LAFGSGSVVVENASMRVAGGGGGDDKKCVAINFGSFDQIVPPNQTHCLGLTE